MSGSVLLRCITEIAACTYSISVIVDYLTVTGTTVVDILTTIDVKHAATPARALLPQLSLL